MPRSAAGPVRNCSPWPASSRTPSWERWHVIGCSTTSPSSATSTRRAARHAELERLAAELQQPLYRHSALAWRAVLTGLAGRFDEAEQLARDSFRLAEGAGAAGRADALHSATGRDTARAGPPRRAPARDRAARAGRCPRGRVAQHPAARLSRRGRPRRERAPPTTTPWAARTRPARTMLWLTAAVRCARPRPSSGMPTAAQRLHGELAPYADRLVQWSFTGNAGSRTARPRARRRSRRPARRGTRALRGGTRTPCRARGSGAAGADAMRLRRVAAQRHASRPTRGARLLRAAAAAARRLGMTGVAARAARQG